MEKNNAGISRPRDSKINQTEKIVSQSGKFVSTYTGSPDSVTIAGYARRFHYSEERKNEVLKKLGRR